jgi:ATP-dependent Clp protease adaptor protein ClpS
MPTTKADREARIQKQPAAEPLYNVVLLNDDDHSYDYVIEMLQFLFYFSTQEAFNHAVEVDLTGRTILVTCSLKEAEFGRDQIHAYGPDHRIPHCRGSMSAVVEPAQAE